MPITMHASVTKIISDRRLYWYHQSLGADSFRGFSLILGFYHGGRAGGKRRGVRATTL